MSYSILDQLAKILPTVNRASLPSSCKEVLTSLKFMSPTIPIEVKMDVNIVGIGYKFWLTKANIVDFLVLEQLKISCIQLYILCLYDFCAKNGKQDIYGFLCPNMIQRVNNNSSKERTGYIGHAMMQLSKNYYFAPIIHKGMTSYNMLNGIWPNHQKPLKWMIVKHHKQPPGSVECGYYVMKYMKMIVSMERQDIEFATLMMEDTSPHTREEIDEVRAEWGLYMLTKCYDNCLGKLFGHISHVGD